MLGQAPLGAIPLGYDDVFPPLIPEEGGGASRLPVSFLRADYAMHRYTKHWFLDDFLEDWQKAGLAGLKEHDEEQSLQSILRAQILERNE